jgi:ABC-type lipoprotein release transport system permease subunit
LLLMQVVLESSLLIGSGVLIGAAAFIATVLTLRNGIDLSFVARGAEIFGAGHVLYMEISVSQTLMLTSITWLLGVAVTLWPAQRAARANPVEAMTHAA